MEWIKCEDRNPPNGVYVLVILYDSREKVNMSFISIAERHQNNFYDGNNGEQINIKGSYVTHWMPLPDLPKE